MLRSLHDRRVAVLRELSVTRRRPRCGQRHLVRITWLAVGLNTFVNGPGNNQRQFQTDNKTSRGHDGKGRPVSITERVVDFVCSTPDDAFPAEARRQAHRAIMDTVGVALAGSKESSSRIVRETIEGSQGESTVIGSARGAAPGDAALANGTAGHALDYDDVQRSLTGHPSVTVAPAALAIAEAVGASGRDLVNAFLVGFEVECRIGRGMGRSHYARGFHETTTLGTLGAAAAGARLFGLNSEQTAHALGVASSMAGGLRANFGSMTKPLQAGNAARGGVMAAEFARRGFTGGHDILDGSIGFLRTFSPADDADFEVVDGLGEEWEILAPGISVKKYPCCFGTHKAADATLALATEHGIAAADIKRVEVHVPASSVGPDGHIGPLIHDRPQTGLEGKFSMQYVVAASLLDHQLKLATFEDDAVQRPSAQALLAKVTPVANATRHPDADSDEYQAIEIHLTNGQVLSRSVSEARGGAADPLSDDELMEKYRDCASLVLPEAEVTQSANLLSQLDDLGDLRELTALLRGSED